jgi:RimJ/RimL family protein N-acetyltransferase
VSLIAPERLQTARLKCERLCPDHAGDLLRLLLDPVVARSLWPWPEPTSETDVQLGLAAEIEHWERHGFGIWLLRDRVTGEMVGRGGLQYTDVTGISAVEVAWAMVPERWGQGLATELACAAAAVALDQMQLPELIAVTLPDNTASRRVMEKAGFAYEREIFHVGLPHVLFVRRRGGGLGAKSEAGRKSETYVRFYDQPLSRARRGLGGTDPARAPAAPVARLVKVGPFNQVPRGQEGARCQPQRSSSTAMIFAARWCGSPTRSLRRTPTGRSRSSASTVAERCSPSACTS